MYYLMADQRGLRGKIGEKINYDYYYYYDENNDIDDVNMSPMTSYNNLSLKDVNVNGMYKYKRVISLHTPTKSDNTSGTDSMSDTNCENDRSHYTIDNNRETLFGGRNDSDDSDK
eukprot:Pgem_evm1s12630